ncbi:MAG: hypothetical protein PHC33_02255 [Candidatus Omnitrophica bacterium]|nr:hypothetical protein [Candidatus Omnitrophota bacterium]
MRRKLAGISVFVCCAAILSGGCSFIGRYHDIMFLKQMADNQKEIDNYVRKQEHGFDVLRGDIENNRLRRGMAKAEVISLYGDPVYCADSGDAPDCRQSCLYRYPTRFFSSAQAYLYFDREQSLCRWEFDPAPTPEIPSSPSK